MLNLGRYDIIKKLSSILNRYNIKFYLVGGAVRDILLDKDPVDFDFTAEIDEEAHKDISMHIASEFHCDYIYNDRFHTCKFIIDGLDVDFIMSRRESYSYCGSIPEVYPSSIIDDLKRRDYTINSIALSLNTFSFGEIIDPLNGISDMKSRLLRVLHEKSFFDDPSRIFRGIKYASRLGFHFESLTDSLIGKSISQGCLSGLKYGRIKQETDTVLSEDNSMVSIDYFRKYLIFNYVLGREVVLKSYTDQLIFNKLDANDKYAAIFYDNDSDLLIKLKKLLNLGSNWVSDAVKYPMIISLAEKDDRQAYYYLFKYCRNISDSVLQLLLSDDPRIKKYLTFRNEIVFDSSDIISISEKDRNEFIINRKIDYILNI